MRAKLLTLLSFALAYASLLAILLDNSTTALCLDHFTWLAAGELNPLTRLMIQQWGVLVAMAANALWSTTLVLWLNQQAHRHRSWFALVFMVGVILLPRGYAAWSNYHLYQALTQ